MNRKTRNLRIKFILVFFVIFIIAAGLLFLAEIRSSAGPVWRGIIIGLSTKGNVLKELGQPNDIKKGLFTTTYIYREENEIKGTHYVKVRYGIVQEIEEDTLVYSDYIKLQSLVKLYGLPYIVEWSLEGPDRRTVIFNNGVIANVIASQLEDAVITKIIYQRKMPTILLRLKYLGIFSSIDPYHNSDIIGEKDPWFGTSNLCRGRCEQ